MRTPIELSLSGITKLYPGVVALRDVDLDIRGGEIVGLIGENGAGKSTLMKVLSGNIQPEEGLITIDGKTRQAMTPRQAADQGIALVYQELNTFTNLDVAGNILLGREIETPRLRALDKKAMAERVTPILELLDAQFGPNDSAADLSLADRQLMEVARALSMDARLIVFDEPTSSLTLTETARLLDIMKQLRRDNVAVLFISHRLSEIQDVVDRVVVLRDGHNAGDLRKADISKARMVEVMVGRNIGRSHAARSSDIGGPVLQLKGVRTKAFPEAAVDLTVHAGEILGVAGLIGAGRSELARAVFGIDARKGTVVLNDQVLAEANVKSSIEAGLCLVPEDRKKEGLILDFGVLDNISLPGLDDLAQNGVVDLKAERRQGKKFKELLGIKVASLRNAVAALSGGNQQKVVLAKWLAMKPKVIILDEPTRGIDVSAKSEVYALMNKLTEQGVGILMISSDMEEVIGVSDRVAVMHGGHVTGVLSLEGLSEERILSLAVA